MYFMLSVRFNKKKAVDKSDHIKMLMKKKKRK